MARSRKRVLIWATGFLLLCLAAFVASAFLLPRQYPTEQTVDRSFQIDQDFTTVRKILVRTNALKRIITMTGESEYLDQNWSALGGGLESINPLDLKWNLELHGTLKVRTLDEYVGQNDVTLQQDVAIDRDQLHSNIELAEGSERLLQYEMTTWFVREEDGKGTRVVQRLKQEILTDAPWFAHRIADRRVYASAERALVNQEAAIRKVIEDNAGKNWLLLQR